MADLDETGTPGSGPGPGPKTSPGSTGSTGPPDPAKLPAPPGPPPTPRTPQESAEGGTFLSAIPFSFGVSEDNLTALGDATMGEHLRVPGSVLPRPSVLATIADCVAGVPSGLLIAPRLSVTLDIVVRLIAPAPGEERGDRLEMRGEIVKQGRSTVAGEVFFYDAVTMKPVAYSYLTFMGSPRPQDRPPGFSRGMRTVGTMEKPFPEHVGARILEPGVAEMERTPFVIQAAGSIQGGAVALLGEVAAESLTGLPVIDLDVRYLSAVRVGPGRATATELGRGLVRVEVRDGGRDDRLIALALARVGHS
jgi:acyl-coenzyme A thioesterase PaaI-like protein